MIRCIRDLYFIARWTDRKEYLNRSGQWEPEVTYYNSYNEAEEIHKKYIGNPIYSDREILEFLFKNLCRTRGKDTLELNGIKLYFSSEILTDYETRMPLRETTSD